MVAKGRCWAAEAQRGICFLIGDSLLLSSIVMKLFGFWASYDVLGLFQPLLNGLEEFLLHRPLISFVKIPLTLRNFFEAPGGSGAADNLFLISTLEFEPRRCYLSDLVITLNRLYEVAELPLLPNEAV